MALVKCSECGKEVSDKAGSCPGCGAPIALGAVTPPKKKTGCLTWMVGGFLALIVIGMVMGGLEESKETEERQRAAAAESERSRAEQQRVAAMTPEERAAFEKEHAEARAAQERARNQQLGLAWNYRESSDQMTGKAIRWALVKSKNEVEFDFPYQGRQRASLQLRVHPRYGTDAILSVERGQFNCGIDGCSVRIRFGDGQPQAFSVNEPDDHSTTYLFIQNYTRFMTALRKVDTIHIEAPFYQEGNRVFEFAVDGLDWK